MSQLLKSVSDMMSANLTILGLLLFFTFFVAVVLMTMMESQKRIYKQMETLPLDGGLAERTQDWESV